MSKPRLATLFTPKVTRNGAFGWQKGQVFTLADGESTGRLPSSGAQTPAGSYACATNTEILPAKGAPRTSTSEISAWAVGSVITTMELLCSAGLGRMEKSSS